MDSPPNTNPFLDFDYEADNAQSELSFNLIESDLDRGERSAVRPSPFESLHLSARPHSPFDDFSTSVGQALLDNSQKLDSNDPSAANTLVNAGQELAKIEEEEANENGVILANSTALESEPTLPEPLIPTTTTTSGVPTQEAITELSRSTMQVNKDAVANLSPAVASAHGFHPSYSTPNIQFHTSGTYPNYAPPTNPFYTYGYQHMTYDSKHLKRPSGPRSPKFAQDIQLSFPQVPLNCQKNKRPPPPKPEPYSRPQVKDQAVDKDDPMFQRLPSLGEFNFDSLLEGGMEAYVKPSNS